MGRGVGKYRIERELGRGGMGIVYLATDQTLEREVAIKVIRPGFHVDRKSIDRFKREARAAAALSHPNVAHINALDEVDDQIVIEMPYLQGGSLRERARSGMSISGLVQCMSDTLAALDACHQAGIIHRDVKPSNVLFDDMGNAKLSDFGAATLAAEELGESISHDSTTFIGTPRYACPEAWNLEKPSAKWDLYSMGVMGWEVLAGELPYGNQPPLMFLQRLQDTCLSPIRELVPEISVELGDLIDSLAARDASRRPNSAAEARERLLETEEASALRSSEDVTAHVRVTRRRLKFWRLRLRNSLTHTFERSRRFSLPVAFGFLVGITAGAWWLTETNTPTGAALVSPEIKTVSQAQALALAIPDVEFLLSTTRSPDDGETIVFDLASPNKMEGEHQLLVALDADRKTGSVLGMFNNRVVLARLNRNADDRYLLDGAWGTYLNEARKGLIFGSVSGLLDWSKTSERPSDFTFEFISAMTTDSWTETYMGIPEFSNATDSRIIHDWERNSIAMPVVLRELLPRYKELMPAAKEFLPTVHGAHLSPIEISSENDVLLDGALVEPFWRPEVGAEPIPRSSPGNLWMAVSEDAFILGIRTELPPGKGEFVRVSILPGYDVPRARSDVLAMEFAGGAVSKADWTAFGETQSVADQIQIHTNQSGARRDHEIRIPFAAIGRVNRPHQDDVFRINVSLGNAADEAPILVWGWPVARYVEHGMLVWFNDEKDETH